MARLNKQQGKIERGEKECTNLISRLVPFSTANSRTGKDKAAETVFKMRISLK